MKDGSARKVKGRLHVLDCQPPELAQIPSPAPDAASASPGRCFENRADQHRKNVRTLIYIYMKTIH